MHILKFVTGACILDCFFVVGVSTCRCLGSSTHPSSFKLDDGRPLSLKTTSSGFEKPTKFSMGLLHSKLRLRRLNDHLVQPSERKLANQTAHRRSAGHAASSNSDFLDDQPTTLKAQALKEKMIKARVDAFAFEVPTGGDSLWVWSDEMVLDPALMSDEQIAEEMARIRRTHLRNAAEAHADGGSALTAEGGNRLIDGLTTDEVEDSFFDVHVSPDVEEEHRAAARVQSFARGRSGRRALKDRQQAAARREAELAAQFASAAPLQLDRREEIAALHSEIEKLRDGRVALVGQLIVARAVMDVMMDAATAELLLDLEEGSEGIRFRISIDAPVSPGPRLISRVHARIARVRAAMTRAAMAALSDRTVMESAPQQLALPSRVRDAIALIEGRAACLDGPVDGARRRHVHHEHVVLAAAVERR